MSMSAQVQEAGSRMGDGLCGMAMTAFASTALVGQSAARGLACGAQEVCPWFVPFNFTLLQLPTAETIESS